MANTKIKRLTAEPGFNMCLEKAYPKDLEEELGQAWGF
jgi:hypothetical protein